MSSSRKGAASKGAQRHQNATAYRASRYGETRQTKLAASVPLAGICSRCKEKLEWKKNYGKYKPLTTPKTCIVCQEKKVKQAYYRYCRDCAESSNVCAKCGEEKEIVDSFPLSAREQAKEEAQFRHGLKMMSERDRRKLLREQGKPLETKTVKSDSGRNDISTDVDSDHIS